MRLKVASQEYVPPEVFIRHQNSRPVPFIKLFEGRLFGENGPIESIIIGPHPDKEHRKEALSIFLDAKGLRGIDIIESEVPYLGV